MDPRNPPEFQLPLVEYELGLGAIEALKAQLGAAAHEGHRVAERLLDIVSNTPGRVVTLAPAGTPSELLNDFEGMVAVHRELFAPWGHSRQWDEWIAIRIAPLTNPYVISLELQQRQSDSYWRGPMVALREAGPSRTLFVDDEPEIEVAQGDAARDPGVIGTVVNVGDALWAAVAFAGESGVELPVEDMAHVSSDLLHAVVGDGPRVIVVNPCVCDDGYLFWEPLGLPQ